MTAEKWNKVYSIGENEKMVYQEQGFDIKDEDGKTIAYGRGKTVPFEEYTEVTKEIDRLQVKIMEMQTENPEVPVEPQPRKEGK